MSDLCVQTCVACSHCTGTGVVDHEECPTCGGMGDEITYRAPTPADILARPELIVAWAAVLSADERTALLVALLRACPNEAVVAVGEALVYGQWRQEGTTRVRRALVSESEVTTRVRWLGPRAGLPDVYRAADGMVYPSWAEACAATDAALMAEGWVLAGVSRV